MYNLLNNTAADFANSTSVDRTGLVESADPMNCVITAAVADAGEFAALEQAAAGEIAAFQEAAVGTDLAALEGAVTDVAAEAVNVADGFAATVAG